VTGETDYPASSLKKDWRKWLKPLLDGGTVRLVSRTKKGRGYPVLKCNQACKCMTTIPKTPSGSRTLKNKQVLVEKWECQKTDSGPSAK